MNKLIALTRVLLKNGTRSGQISSKKRLTSLVVSLVLVFALLPWIAGVSKLTSEAYDAASIMGQEGIILSLGMGINSFIIFFYGMFYVVNTYYFSKDIEKFLPLPLKPSQIICGKFLITLIYEYVTELLISAPIIVTYGIKSSAGIPFFIYSIFIILLLPVIPLVFASLIIMLIMSFSKATVNKDRVRFAGALTSIVLALGINVLTQKLSNRSISPEEIVEMLQKGKNSLVGLTSSIFPTSYFATVSLTDSNTLKGLLNFVIFLAITAVGMIFFLFAAERLYFKGAIGLSESAARRKNISSSDLGKATIQGSAFKAIVLKDFRIILRTPIFFINCFLSNLIWPVFMALPFLSNMEGNSLQDIFKIARTIDESWIFACGVLFIAFTSSSNNVAASAISREGQNIYISKYIPASYKMQILAKAFTSFLISTINLIILCLISIFIFRISPVGLLMVIITSLLAIIAVSCAGVMIDLARPKLNWDSEQKAVKQNLNALFSSIVGVIVGGLALLLKIYFKLDLLPAFLVMSGIYLIICTGMYKLISTVGVKLFEKL